VKALCTTDDLACHKALAASALETKVYSCFRPDKALNVHLPEAFNAWVDRLEAASSIGVTR
jgi:glucuronate isomerase